MNIDQLFIAVASTTEIRDRCAIAILSLLHKHGAMTVTKIAEKLGKSLAAISNCMSSCSNDGLVKCRISKEDKRLRIYSIAPAGVELLKIELYAFGGRMAEAENVIA